MNIASECFDNSIRAEKILWLSCQAAQYTDELREFFTGDMSAEKLTEIFGGAVKFTEKELEEASESRSGMDDQVGEFVSRLYRAGKRGFLVQAATPTPTDFHESGYSTAGFGLYATQWFYTEALDAAFVERLLAWKEAFVEKCRKKAADKAKARTRDA